MTKEPEITSQWCNLHDIHQDHPDHDYSARCESHLRDSTVEEDKLVKAKLVYDSLDLKPGISQQERDRQKDAETQRKMQDAAEQIESQEIKAVGNNELGLLVSEAEIRAEATPEDYEQHRAVSDEVISNTTILENHPIEHPADEWRRNAEELGGVTYDPEGDIEVEFPKDNPFGVGDGRKMYGDQYAYTREDIDRAKAHILRGGITNNTTGEWTGVYKAAADELDRDSVARNPARKPTPDSELRSLLSDLRFWTGLIAIELLMALVLTAFLIGRAV